MIHFIKFDLIYLICHKKMAKLVLCCLLLLTNVIQISPQVTKEIGRDDQFLCGSNKYLLKCGCGQETNEYEHNIPLFNIDCSRLDLFESPAQEQLPLFLGHLDLSFNQIIYLNESVRLSSDTLHYLDYSHNKIKAISVDFFRDLSQLKILNLKNNQIDNFNLNIFYGLKNLQELNLESNHITQLLQFESFKSMPKLKQLKLGYNELGSFLTNIKLVDFMPDNNFALYLDHVNLKIIHPDLFQDMNNIIELSLAYNPIKELPNLNLGHLKYLDISGTNLTDFNSTNMQFANLRVLKMNRLPYLRQLNEHVFYHLNLIEELYVEHCIRLEQIDELAFGVLDSNTSINTMKKFSIAHSNVRTLSYSYEILFGHLQEIQLRGNNWMCDCRLSWLTDVKKNVKDNSETRCSHPEPLRNVDIFDVAKNNLSCLVHKENHSHYSTFQKWLFPIVGTLTLIVASLVAILIYMGPYEAEVATISATRNIGPDSPYRRVTMTIDSNAAELLWK